MNIEYVLKTSMANRRESGRSAVPVAEIPGMITAVQRILAETPPSLSLSGTIDIIEGVIMDAERRFPTPEQLRAFNDERARQFGRAPTPENPLPMTPTGRGGDVGPEETP